jgi:hypothetical protein
METDKTSNIAINAVEKIAPVIAAAVPASPLAPFLEFIGRNVRAHPLRAALVGVGVVLVVASRRHQRQKIRRRRAVEDA